jgi:hypothetical protein
MGDRFPGVTPGAVTEMLAVLMRELHADTERLLAAAQRLRADNAALSQQNREELARLTAAIQRFRAAYLS